MWTILWVALYYSTVTVTPLPAPQWAPTAEECETDEECAAECERKGGTRCDDYQEGCD